MVSFLPHPFSKQIVALCQSFVIDPQLGVALQVGDAVSSPDLATVKGHFEQLWGWSQEVMKPSGRLIDYPKSVPLGDLRRHFFLTTHTEIEPKSGVETRSLHYEEGPQLEFEAIWHGRSIVFKLTKQPDGSEQLSLQLSLGSNRASVSIEQPSWRDWRTPFESAIPPSWQAFALNVKIFDTDVLRDSLSSLSYPLQEISPELDLMAAVAWLVYQDDPTAFPEGFGTSENNGQNLISYNLHFSQDGTPHLLIVNNPFEPNKNGLEVDLTQFKPRVRFSYLSNHPTGFGIHKEYRDSPWSIHYQRPVQQDTGDDRFSCFVRRLLPKLEEIGERMTLEILGTAARTSESDSALLLGKHLDCFGLSSSGKIVLRPVSPEGTISLPRPFGDTVQEGRVSLNKVWKLATTLFDGGLYGDITPLKVPGRGEPIFCFNQFWEVLHQKYGIWDGGGQRKIAGAYMMPFGSGRKEYGKGVVLERRRQGDKIWDTTRVSFRNGQQRVEVSYGFPFHGQSGQDGTPWRKYKMVVRSRELMSTLLGLGPQDLLEDWSLSGEGIKLLLLFVRTFIQNQNGFRFKLGMKPGETGQHLYKLQVEKNRLRVYDTKTGCFVFSPETLFAGTKYLLSEQAKHRVEWQPGLLTIEVTTYNWSLPSSIYVRDKLGMVYQWLSHDMDTYMDVFDRMSPLEQEQWLIQQYGPPEDRYPLM